MMPSSERPSLSKMVVGEPCSVTPSSARRCTRMGVETIGSTVHRSTSALSRTLSSKCYLPVLPQAPPLPIALPSTFQVM